MPGSITHIRGPLTSGNSLATQSIARNAHVHGFTVYGNAAFCSLYDGHPWAPTPLPGDFTESSSSVQIDRPCIVVFDQLDLATIVMEALQSKDMCGQQVALMHLLSKLGAHLILAYQAEASLDPAVLPKSDVLLEIRG
jgi:hypothetical protein